MTAADRRDPVPLVLPYIENPEPLAAGIAYGERARAPYGALRWLKPRIEAATIIGWSDDPQLASRRSAHTLLLGIAGGPQDAEGLEQRLAAALFAVMLLLAGHVASVWAQWACVAVRVVGS
jgi:hypothetical protein